MQKVIETVKKKACNLIIRLVQCTRVHLSKIANHKILAICESNLSE